MPQSRRFPAVTVRTLPSMLACMLRAQLAIFHAPHHLPLLHLLAFLHRRHRAACPACCFSLIAHHGRLRHATLRTASRARTLPPAAACATAKAARAGTPSSGAPPPAPAARTSARPRVRSCLPWSHASFGYRSSGHAYSVHSPQAQHSSDHWFQMSPPVMREAQAAHHLVRLHFVAQQIARAELGAVAALVAGRFADVAHLRAATASCASSGNDRAAARSGRRWSWSPRRPDRRSACPS